MESSKLVRQLEAYLGKQFYFHVLYSQEEVFMAIDEAQILVVGAGPVGLTMAAELARRGIPCRIIDTKEGITDKSKALVVHSRMMELLENMGIIQSALDKGLRSNGASIFAEGHRIIHITLDDLDTPIPFSLTLTSLIQNVSFTSTYKI